MLTRLLQTEDEKALGIARIVLGLLFFVRGAQGVLGWFGGSGIHDLDSLLRVVSLPAPLVALAAIISLFGGIGLIAGLFTRIAAVSIVADTASMLGLWVIDPTLFLDWSMTQGGASIEYYLLAFVVASVLVAKGAGGFSVDRVLFHRRLRHRALWVVSSSGRREEAWPKGRPARTQLLP